MPSFQFSQDTAAAWGNTSRVPNTDEVCLTTDTRELRIGDGVTAWSNLRAYQPSATPEFFNATPDSLRALRLLLGRARSSTTTLAPVVMLGASVDTGVGGAGSQGSYGLLATRSLWALGVPQAGTGWVPAWNNTTDTRWTHQFAAATTDVMYRASTASGQSETFQADVSGTVVQVALTGDSGACTITIDGTSQTVTGTGGTAGTVNVLTYSGQTAIPHKVVVSSTTATAVKLIGIRVGGTSGLEFHGWAISGAKSAQTSKTNGLFGSPGNMLTSLVTTSGVVMIGADVWFNDGGTAANTSSTTTAVGQAIADAQTAGHQVILTLPHSPNPSTTAAADWTGWRQAVYALAAQYNVPLLDMTRRWGTYAWASSNGYMFDNVHATALGYEDWAGALGSLLTQGYLPAPDHFDPSPVPLTLQTGFTSFGSGFYTPSYAKDRSGVVRLSGLVNTPATTGGVIATLPAGYRPGVTRGVGVVSNNAAARVDILNNGNVLFAAGTVSSWLSLEGVEFVPDA